MIEKIEELKALLEQEEANLTEYGKERITVLKNELRDIYDCKA
jgi:hypothetical protein